jgi:DNA-binding CsgD family transcriptional regulator
VTRLSERDVHGALALVADAAASRSDQPFEATTVERFLQLIPSRRCGFYEFSGGGRACGRGNTFSIDVGDAAPEIDWVSESVASTIERWPLLDRRLSSSSTAWKLSDFLAKAALGRNPFHAQFMRPRGFEYQMKVWLPAPSGTVRGFYLLRGPHDGDFDERDRAMLQLLRPHLARIRDAWERREYPSPLTRREAEILRLVRDGLTNSQIAAALVLAPTTIRAHLEHIFAKLNVHTRTAAVAWLNSQT